MRPMKETGSWEPLQSHELLIWWTTGVFSLSDELSESLDNLFGF
jgi:hypothetical protein